MLSPVRSGSPEELKAQTSKIELKNYNVKKEEPLEDEYYDEEYDDEEIKFSPKKSVKKLESIQHSIKTIKMKESIANTKSKK